MPFLALYSFLPNVSADWIVHCVRQRYAPSIEQRPYGLCRVQPTCAVPLEGKYYETNAFRNDQERKFTEHGFRVTRTRLVSTLDSPVVERRPFTDSIFAEPVDAHVPLLHVEAILTLAVKESFVPDVVAFMRDRNCGVYRDILIHRDDGLQTWRMVVRGPERKPTFDFDVAEFEVRARKGFNVVDFRLRRVHFDSKTSMDDGWIVPVPRVPTRPLLKDEEEVDGEDAVEPTQTHV